MALHTKCINTGSPDTSDPLPTCLERLLVLLNFGSVKLCKCFFIGVFQCRGTVMVSSLMKVLGLKSGVYRRQKLHVYLSFLKANCLGNISNYNFSLKCLSTLTKITALHNFKCSLTS